MFTPELMIAPDERVFIAQAEAIFARVVSQSIQERGIFSAALSGGSTPKPLYQRLASSKLIDEAAWKVVHLFWGDERHVPANHPDSNYRMVQEALLSHVPVEPEHIHRVPTEMDVRLAAFAYEEHLRSFFPGEWPRFDLVLLGMGADGHTASLFPHSAGLNETFRWFIANKIPEQKSWRLTLTRNAINAARNILVMVKGEDKAETVSKVLTGSYVPEERPIQLIMPDDGEMIFLLDQGAAHLLPAK